LPSSLQNKKLKVEFYFTSSTDVYYVSVRKAGVRVPLSTDSVGATALPTSTTGKFVAYFDTDNSGSWTVHLTRVTGSGSSLQFTNVVVGPGIQPQGAVVGEWTSYTPTFSGFGTVTTQNFLWRRVGDSIQIEGTFQAGTVAATAASITLPLSFTYSKFPNANGWGTSVGHYNNNQTTSGIVLAAAAGGNLLNFAGAGTTTVTATGTTVAGASSGVVTLFAQVPIDQWAGSGTVQLAQNDVEYAYNTSGLTTAGGSNTLAFGYGPAGAVLGSIASTTQATSYTTMRVRFQTPIQAGDSIVVEFDGGQNQWMPAPNRSPWIINNAAVYGVQAVPVFGSLTDVDVLFGNSGQQSLGATTYGSSGSAWSNISTWKWRVRKSSAGAAVGVGLVAKDSAGLLPAYNTNLDDATATRLGLKQYLGSGSYVGGAAPTITLTAGGGTLSSYRSVCVPYQCQDGTWRLKFNIYGNLSSLPRTTVQYSITGVVFISSTSQAVAGFVSGTTVPPRAGCDSGAATVTLDFASTTTTSASVSGDVELASKPTWAYS
jgi:hypothetical protein